MSFALTTLTAGEHWSIRTTLRIWWPFLLRSKYVTHGVTYYKINLCGQWGVQNTRRQGKNTIKFLPDGLPSWVSHPPWNNHSTSILASATTLREINPVKLLLFHNIFVIVALFFVQKTSVFGCVAFSATPPLFGNLRGSSHLFGVFYFPADCLLDPLHITSLFYAGCL